MSSYHTPVLLSDALAFLSPHPEGVFVDATLGGGGYSEELLRRVAPGGTVIGIDRDESALREASCRLKPWGDAFVPVRGNFSDLEALLDSLGVKTVDGVVFDLGVSSHQLDEQERGFSFRSDAPLDMRMDRSQPCTAAHLLGRLSEPELTRVLRDYSEERWAARISKFIVQRRVRSPLETTNDLVQAIEAAVPQAARPTGIHVATRTFQALRIAVNRELEALEQGLDAALNRLSPGGRLVAISYHSLEDRIVKSRIQSWEKPCICPPNLPICGCGRLPQVRPLTKGAVMASPEEVAENPRSRSARLRAAEKATAEEQPLKSNRN